MFISSGESSHALYAGGLFTVAGGAAANRVARWDGAAWRALGWGVGRSSVYGPNNEYVNALAMYDDGDGLALYAGGDFDRVADIPARGLALFRDGHWWPVLGEWDREAVLSLAVFDDGAGPALFVGGYVDGPQGRNEGIICRRGQEWRTLGDGLPGAVTAMTVFDDGSGPALYAGGTFTIRGQTGAGRNIARWDGTGWTGLGAGLNGQLGFWPPGVFALAVFDDGAGPALYAAGSFTRSGTTELAGLAKWDGSAWSAVPTPAPQGYIYALTAHEDSRGPALFAGGELAEQLWHPMVARWDGSSWSQLGTPTVPQRPNYPGVFALASFPRDDEQTLWVGGQFTRWNETDASFVATWSASTPVQGDADGDRRVTLRDLATLLSNFATSSGASRADGDFDEDGDVDVADLATLLSHFGTACP